MPRLIKYTKEIATYSKLKEQKPVNASTRPLSFYLPGSDFIIQTAKNLFHTLLGMISVQDGDPICFTKSIKRSGQSLNLIRQSDHFKDGQRKKKDDLDVNVPIRSSCG